MSWARDITQLCCSSNLAGIVVNKIGQSFYSVYSYSGIESIERTVNSLAGIPSNRVAFIDFSLCSSSKTNIGLTF